MVKPSSTRSYGTCDKEGRGGRRMLEGRGSDQESKARTGKGGAYATSPFCALSTKNSLPSGLSTRANSFAA